MNQKLLSICIPTWNRAPILETTLNNIITQALEFKDKVEICISNNGSTDNTRKLVMKFKEKYPDLIKYNENKKNLGFDINLLKVIDMASGNFVWTLSDDDFIVKDGIKTVVKVVIEVGDKNVGGIALKDSSYVLDTRTGNKIKYHSTVDNNKPEVYGGLGCAEVLQEVPYRFVSVLIFNNNLLKKLLRKKDLVQKGLGSYYLHSWLYILLFLLNKKAKCYVINKSIIISPDAKPRYKFMLEDNFKLIYYGKIKFFDNLLSIVDKSDKNIINIINKKKAHPNIDNIYAMALYKAFGIANYTSCVGCIKLLFKYLSFAEALLISMSFIIILITPSKLIKKLFKCGLKLRLGKQLADSKWLEISIVYTHWNMGKDGCRRVPF
ncbi:MAG: glycosyltransferase [Candidatus Thermoplasmatota archaeon]|nr:glycosyltransferase [Candidatus Thermoplasmatota archaeon]